MLHDSLATRTTPNVEARDRPDGQIVDRSQLAPLIEPGELRSRREPAPPERDAVLVEGQQTRRRPCFHLVLQRDSVLLAGPAVVVGADDPVHAPATVRCPGSTEQVFKSRPQVARDGLDGGDAHVNRASIAVAGGTSRVRTLCSTGMMRVAVGDHVPSVANGAPSSRVVPWLPSE